MPRSLYDGNIRVLVLTDEPADLKNVTAVEAAAGVDIAGKVMRSDFRLGAVASDNLDQAVLNASGNATDFGSSNYEGLVTVFWMLDPVTGARIALEDTVWDLFSTKGTRLWLLRSDGYPKEVAATPTVGQRYNGFEVVTDNPQEPQDRAGYVRNTVPLGVQNGYLNRKLV